MRAHDPSQGVSHVPRLSAMGTDTDADVRLEAGRALKSGLKVKKSVSSSKDGRLLGSNDQHFCSIA